MFSGNKSGSQELHIRWYVTFGLWRMRLASLLIISKKESYIYVADVTYVAAKNKQLIIFVGIFLSLIHCPISAITQLVWNGPGDTQDLLWCWSRQDWTKQQIAGVRGFQLISGGWFGRKVIQDVLRRRKSQSRWLTKILYLVISFWCKK